MLLMIENGIQGGICHAIHRYAKANNKYMKNYHKNIEYNSAESSCFMYLDASILYRWAMSLKLSVNGFKQVQQLSQFNEDFITHYDKNGNKGYFLEVDIEYAKNLFNLHKDLPFLTNRKKIKNCNKLVCDIHDKENQLLT